MSEKILKIESSVTGIYLLRFGKLYNMNDNPKNNILMSENIR